MAELLKGKEAPGALTPAMRQYLEIKAGLGEAILFFRMGDFYEMFFDDAEIASKVLGITLTTRDRNRKIPMCGVPYHSALPYIKKLVDEGYRVAICEQVSEPGTAGGIVKREVTRVITPGTILDTEMLDAGTNNFIASAAFGAGRWGFAYMDVSTGEFRVTEIEDISALVEEIGRVKPLELLVARGSDKMVSHTGGVVKKLTPLDERDFQPGRCRETLRGHFGRHSLDGLGIEGFDPGVSAAGALLGYIKDTQRSELPHVKGLKPYFRAEFMVVDRATHKNLAIMESPKGGASLLDIIDSTRTAIGRRRLKDWLLHPLRDVSRITARLDAVTELIECRRLRDELSTSLEGVYDLERLSTRVSMGLAGPRDLRSLLDSLKRVEILRSAMAPLSSPLLAELRAALDPAPQTQTLIDRAISERPPALVREGGVIRKGYSAELDELRETSSGGKDWLIRLEAGERQRTGINNLKVGFNRVFGYYIEVSKSNLGAVPDDYIRKQTLTGAERFVTEDLKKKEAEILTAEERALALEAELFSALVAELAPFMPAVRETAGAVSVIDVLVSFADVAEKRNYVRPVVEDSGVIEIRAGRHPVVEAASKGDFVPNDLVLDDERQIIILTGPNMAGKSTFLRQNALICFMAQTGSFVPAESATLGVLDRIFTRVGADDDLAAGKSTFMVEMNETANILNNTTERSLVILDEIGRGTSTYDGLSIAWAVVEYLHDRKRTKTLFATHYHELTELSLTKQRVKNYNMAVREWGGRIIFLRKVLPGEAPGSYGIEVARLAGLPEEVTERAAQILANLETGELGEDGLPRLAGPQRGAGPAQMNLLGQRDRLREALKEVDPDRTTPLEALILLKKLKEKAEGP